MKPTDDAARCRLAREVFDNVYDHTETFREAHLGADLAYLLGAILGEDSEQAYVDWTSPAVDQNTIDTFKQIFPTEHPVWDFITLLETPSR